MKEILFLYMKSHTGQVKVHTDKERWTFQDWREAWRVYDCLKSLNIDYKIIWREI